MPPWHWWAGWHPPAGDHGRSPSCAVPGPRRSKVRRGPVTPENVEWKSNKQLLWGGQNRACKVDSPTTFLVMEIQKETQNMWKISYRWFLILSYVYKLWWGDPALSWVSPGRLHRGAEVKWGGGESHLWSSMARVPGWEVQDQEKTFLFAWHQGKSLRPPESQFPLL